MRARDVASRRKRDDQEDDQADVHPGSAAEPSRSTRPPPPRKAIPTRRTTRPPDDCRGDGRAGRRRGRDRTTVCGSGERPRARHAARSCRSAPASRSPTARRSTRRRDRWSSPPRRLRAPSRRSTAAAGRFRITQPKSSALTTLRLTAPLPRCGPGRGIKVLRRLRVAANGKFRTVGARGYATGKSRKASWVIVDRCVPVRRSLAIGGKAPKRKLQTCVLPPGSTNPSKHTQADLHDPAGRKQKGNCIPAP